ncbi:hypothetical protein GCM10027022_08730 [Alpinimonas psychrophila]|uniref:ABC3 transporter permease C-terminal domain-containing protein n=1 Tax=Alpinimonas psychrophila TaxID=748908 RepID=A0A7W3JT41_9MICO|nr:FtsX-like permease family protein [Alpinimonas psychrophila]MBA8828695.1 hypothetical protein [Alpinimonas psychrophila]
MSFDVTRLLIAHDRDSKKRLLGISAGVAVGVSLILLIWGTYNGLLNRELRSAWTQLGPQSALPFYVFSNHLPNQGAAQAELTDSQALASVSSDYYQGRSIERIMIAVPPGYTGSIPGIARIPEPGTYLASPALAALINSVPADQLASRFGTLRGVISDAALASPDSLVVLIGQSPASVSQTSNAKIVTEFTGAIYGGNVNYLTLAIIGAIATLIPVLLLVGIVTGLGVAQRRERFATLRLIGAPPGVVSRIAASETALTSTLGAVAGVIFALLLAPLAAKIPIDGMTFFVSDIVLDPLSVGLVAVVTIVVTTLVAWMRARRVGFGSLGTTQQQHEKPPRAFALIPLILGIVAVLTPAATSKVQGFLHRDDLAIFTGFSRPEFYILGGFVLTTIGLLVAGPYLTFLTSRLAAHQARSAAGVVAFNRIRRLPRAMFRSVSGLVAALFLVTVFATAVTTVYRATALADDAEHLSMSTLISRPLADPTPEQMRVLNDAPGVTHAGLGLFSLETSAGLYFTRTDAQRLGLMTATQGATITTDYVEVNSGIENNEPVAVREAPGVLATELENSILFVATDGTPANVEKARTSVILSDIEMYTSPSTRSELQANDMDTLASSFATLANIGILITALISVVSLAVATIGGVLDRRRIFGLLRLMGMPVRTLRRIIASETALPFVTVFGVCIALGVTVAWAIVTGLSPNRTIDWPDPSFHVVIALSLALAALSIAATLRSAEKHTGISATRYE